MNSPSLSFTHLDRTTLDRLNFLVSQIRFFNYDRPEFVRAVLLFDRLKLDLAHQFYPLSYLPLIEAIEHEIALKYQPIALNSNPTSDTLIRKTENIKPV